VDEKINHEEIMRQMGIDGGEQDAEQEQPSARGEGDAEE
jgi:hypothetical protein